MKLLQCQITLFSGLLFLSVYCTVPEKESKELSDTYLEDLDSLRAQISYHDRITYLQLVGLLALDSMEENSFGRDSTNDHVLELEAIPEKIGYFEFTDQGITFQTADGITVKDNAGDTVIRRVLSLDDYGNSEMLYHERLRWMVKSFQDHRFIRIWDDQNPQVNVFQGYKWYDPKVEFRFQAYYEPYTIPRKIKVPTSMQAMDELSFIGEVRFQYRSKSYQLSVLEGGFLMFADQTSGESTYGSGRYLDLNLPEQGGSLILDFNLAYNPPCAFSEFTTCRFPPKENWLSFKVTAGEQYPH